MNSKQKYVILVALILIAVVLVWWLASGSEVFTKSQVLVDKTNELEKMLGVKTEVWEDKFIFGLLPSGMSFTVELLSVVTLSAIVLIFCAILFVKLKS
jgi:hypothetical protein